MSVQREGSHSSGDSILTVTNLRKLFALRRTGFFGRGNKMVVHAVDGVSFDLRRGEVLALVGESGCGKSTLALTLIGLEQPTAGEIRFEGAKISGYSVTQMKSVRRHMQMIFQDPYESLNPLMSIGEIVAEPLKVHKIKTRPAERQALVVQAMEDAGLKPANHFTNRLPHELSGGQRQRVVIASALVLKPTLLLADEPVSMLDVSIRAEILNLLADLRDKRGISILFITHDLSTVGALADRVAVMYLGRIVEIGPTLTVLQHPQHPYTQALLSVVPVPNPRLRQKRIILRGETPDPVNLPSGCRFHPRCPLAINACRHTDPLLHSVGPQQEAACLLLA
jgi:oligopeptide/dipeptide ABC transporter ATP-binding protein